MFWVTIWRMLRPEWMVIYTLGVSNPRDHYQISEYVKKVMGIFVEKLFLAGQYWLVKLMGHVLVPRFFNGIGVSTRFWRIKRIKLWKQHQDDTSLLRFCYNKFGFFIKRILYFFYRGPKGKDKKCSQFHSPSLSQILQMSPNLATWKIFFN